MKNFIFEITYGNGQYEGEEGWETFSESEYHSHKVMFTDVKEFLFAANKFSGIAEVVDQFPKSDKVPGDKRRSMFHPGDKTPMEVFNTIMEELCTSEESWEKRQHEGKCEWRFRWFAKPNNSDARFVKFTIRRNSDMRDILNLGLWVGKEQEETQEALCKFRLSKHS